MIIGLIIGILFVAVLVFGIFLGYIMTEKIDMIYSISRKKQNFCSDTYRPINYAYSTNFLNKDELCYIRYPSTMSTYFGKYDAKEEVLSIDTPHYMMEDIPRTVYVETAEQNGYKILRKIRLCIDSNGGDAKDLFSVEEEEH